MPLSWNEIKTRALAFSLTWADASNEDSQAKPFWLDFFEIFGITNKRVAVFEQQVKKLGDKQGFVDLFWPGMLLVEHKSRGKNLDLALQQALDYFPGLAERDLPQIIIVCDFARFRVYDLAASTSTEFALHELHQHIELFGFIAGYKVQVIREQDPVNVRAAECMGRLHDALKANQYDGHPLEVLLVRLLFCLFADDTGIVQPAQSFRAFIEERTAPDGSDLGPRLIQIFQVLNTPTARRAKALDQQLAQFPYINGKLFDECLPMPDFTSAMRDTLLDACALDWSAISPAIFGSLFQSIMDSTARRNLGAHYTSEENILKLIGPLFLDDLYAQFHKIKIQRQRLLEFHQKLRHITFFDPACGCGNFLVISYRELRKLEMEVLRASHQLSGLAGQQSMDVHSLIGVDVDQCYGIEIEEFPAQIAQVALWLVDHQMNMQVSAEFGLYFARIPLKTNSNIVHGNALRLDWNAVLPAERCSFVLGNPPFVGKKEQSAAQKADFVPIMGHIKGFGVLDFVTAWHVKATSYIQPFVKTGLNSAPRCAFVSTNSITQGEQVGVLWSWLLAQGVHIQFAHRAFNWTNEARGKAAVHCVIVGFGMEDRPDKVIYQYEDIKGKPHAVAAKNINPYLVDAPSVALVKRSQPICKAPDISYGSMANDDGHLILSSAEKDALLQQDAAWSAFIRPYVGAQEFLNSLERWCLWLVDVPLSLLRNTNEVSNRIEAVRKFRSASNREATRTLAYQPSLFGEIRQPEAPFLLLPKVSSESRRFMPIGFLPPDVVANGSALIIKDAGLLEFGVLQSTMHMAWMRATAGRMKSDYQYSAQIVYNNFPWPDIPATLAPNKPITPAHKAQAAIEIAAQTVLDTRAQYFPAASLADLYDPLVMPAPLLKAHQKLDAAVDKAYQLCGGKKSYASDAERVAFLFERYQQLTSLLPVAGKKPRAPRRPSPAAQ